MEIRDSFATGNVSTSSTATDAPGSFGGFIGANLFIDEPVTIEHCYASGAVAGHPVSDFSAAGGFIGTAGSAAIQQSFTTGAITGDNTQPFGHFAGAPVHPSNRYNSDVSPIVPGQGTPASLASGVFSQPNANFNWTWPTGSGGWTFSNIAQLPRLTDVP